MLGVAVVAVVAWRSLGAGSPTDGQGAGRPPPLVETAPVSRRTVDVTVFSTGTLQAPDEVMITAESAGRITALRFTEGDSVNRGDVLVTLERERQAATVKQREARLDEARRNLTRLRALEDDRFTSESDLDTARTAVSEAEAALAIARDQLADRTIEAPFAGVLGERQVSPGALLEVGEAVVPLTRLDPLDLSVDIPERYLPSIEAGMRMTATTEAMPDRRFDGEVTFIDSEVDADTRTVLVEASIPNPQGTLRPGQFMRAQLVLSRRDAVTVPEAAVLTRGPVSYVYVVDDEAVAERRTVKTRLRRDGWVEIAEGLEAGERVVVAGLQRVRSGSPVRLQEEKTPPQDTTAAAAVGASGR